LRRFVRSSCILLLPAPFLPKEDPLVWFSLPLSSLLGSLLLLLRRLLRLGCSGSSHLRALSLFFLSVRDLKLKNTLPFAGEDAGVARKDAVRLHFGPSSWHDSSRRSRRACSEGEESRLLGEEQAWFQQFLEWAVDGNNTFDEARRLIAFGTLLLGTQLPTGMAPEAIVVETATIAEPPPTQKQARWWACWFMRKKAGSCDRNQHLTTPPPEPARLQPLER